MIINIDPVAFYIPVPVIGWWPVYWYGISWLVAILGVNFAAKRIGILYNHPFHDFLLFLLKVLN